MRGFGAAEELSLRLVVDDVHARRAEMEPAAAGIKLGSDLLLSEIDSEDWC